MSGLRPAVTTAVILAAGRGTRLAGELQDRPKGFLCLGKQAIIEESIDRLVAAGISDVVIEEAPPMMHIAKSVPCGFEAYRDTMLPKRLNRPRSVGPNFGQNMGDGRYGSR